MKDTLKMKIIDNAKKTEDLIVFLADTEDAALLKEAEDVCFPRDPWSEQMFSDALANPSCRIFILYNTQLSKIVAYGVMYYCLDEADLANIAVLPEERGSGLGGKLLDIMLEDARNYGVLRVFLEVRESNAPARRLYASRSFKEIGKRKKYYRDPSEDAVIMEREELI